MFLEKELALAERLALHAGALALAMRETLTIQHKPGELGPVTNADKAIDAYIVQELAENFPSDRIISEEAEESHCSPINSGRVWFVDPIDGTTSYIVGRNDFVVMIGLAIDGVARLGVVYQPTTKRLWRAINHDIPENRIADRLDEHGCTSIRITSSERPTDLTLIASRTRRSRRQAEVIRRFSPREVVYCSSIGLKTMVIAEGGADFYIAWSNHIKMWDTCAPAAIFSAAGGIFARIDGQPLKYLGDIDHGCPVLVSSFQPNQAFYDELLKIAII